MISHEEVIHIQKDDILSGRYKIIELLGTGAFGEVYLARHLVLHQYRAVKCIRHDRDPEGIALREAGILKNLRHPSIPIIYDIEQTEDSVCIIEEYLEGSSLHSLLSNNRILPSRALKLCISLCRTTAYLHDQGVYHLDIKPSNLLIRQDEIMLLDYGSAVSAGENQKTHMGTAYYAAPEMYGTLAAGAVTDVYSIGVILCLMLTGGHDSESVSDIRPHSLKQIVKGCLAHSGKVRFQRIEDLEQALSKVLQKNDISYVPGKISIAGIHPHAGTTHAAIMLSSDAKQSGHRMLLCECNNSGHFHSMIHGAHHASFQSGIFTLDGVDMITQYNLLHNPELAASYEGRICDYGVLSNENLPEILDSDWILLITGPTPYEIGPLVMHGDDSLAAHVLRERGKNTRILVNYTNGTTYHRLLNRYGIHCPVRVPYNPEPFTYRGTRRRRSFCVDALFPD